VPANPWAAACAAGAQELKERGVGFLVVKDTERLGRDLFYNRAYWGVTEIGEWRGGRLYRFN